MTNLPTIDMAVWSMLDFELAVAGVRHVNEASLWLQNQPRAYNKRKLEYHPGAEFIVALGQDWCGQMMDDIIRSLEQRRFRDPDDQDRRLRLLLSYHASFGPAGDALPDLMVMLEKWRAPLAA